jgi:hypothetical protein
VYVVKNLLFKEQKQLEKTTTDEEEN